MKSELCHFAWREKSFSMSSWISKSLRSLETTHTISQTGARIFVSRGGFTLIELLVSMGIALIVMSAVYSTYYSQQKQFITQDIVAEMQQNVRSALYNLERDVRMAGYDPTGNASAGFVTAGTNSIRVTMDLNGDGDVADTNENVTYSLSSNNLLRNSVIQGENIVVLNFVYLDENRAVTADVKKIRSVQITTIGRTSRVDLGYNDSDSYANQQGTVILTTPNDAYRRKIVSTEVRCRNMGLV